MEEVNKGLHINIDSLSNPDNEKGAGLPVDGLTDSLQRIIRELSDYYQSPQDFVAASMFHCAGTLLGNKVKLVSEFNDVPMMWMITVGISGAGKSKALNKLGEYATTEDSRRTEAYRRAMAIWEQSKDAEKQEKPRQSQLILNVQTQEALYNCLFDNPNGIMIAVDEISGFFGNLNRYNKGDDESEYLSIWSGQRLKISRKSELPRIVEHPFINIFGGIQKERLRKIFTEERNASGFSQRFLFVFPQEIKPEIYSDYVKPEPDISYWDSLCEKMMLMQATNLTLTPEARHKYNEYRNGLSMKMQGEADDICGLYAKLRIYAARWAIVAHVLGNDASSMQVTERDMDYSIRCMGYFEDCWKRAYQIAMSPKKKEPSVTETIQYFWQYAKKRNPKLTEQQLADAFGGTRQQVHNVISAIPKKP